MEVAFEEFIRKVVEINMTFPNNYRINGDSKKSENTFLKWYLEKDCSPIELYNEFIKIKKELNVTFEY
jgi:hypothetical protein